MVSSISNSFSKFEQLLIAVAILCIATSTVSGADINQICSKTRDLPLCHKVLKSIPGAARLDLVTPGKTTINDTIAYTEEILSFMGTLSSNETDPQIKKNIDFCASNFGDTVRYLWQAQDEFIPFNYFSVEIDVGNALDGVDICIRAIGSSLPSLSAKIKNLMSFCDIIAAICYFLWKP